MMTRFFNALCMGWMMMTPLLAEESFYKKHKEGWFWYEDCVFDKEDEPLKKEKKAAEFWKPKTLAEVARARVEKTKKDLETARMVALEFPTQANVQKYMRLQKAMMDKAEVFSIQWGKAVLINPDLNPEIQNPTASYARSTYYGEQNKIKDQKIKSLAKTHGLLYIFKSNCPYCTNFAPIVKMFSEKYKWNVMAISADGGSCTHFPNALPDNGIVESLQIQSAPALIAYNSETNEVIPISYAMTSLEQLETNITTLVEDNPVTQGDHP